MTASARANVVVHEGERGFALLLVFLMAAIIGIALFAELPRVALQAQRAKEQLLLERGEQIKRAIQLFVRANKGTRFPADMDDLDRGYNNLRFLRHRYKDPMTGKDEWRIIHMQGGVLTDSLLTKPKDGDKKEDLTLGQNISERAGLGQMADAGLAQPNATNRRRMSEGGMGGQPGQSSDQTNGTQPAGAPSDTSQPAPGAPGTVGGPMSPFSGAPGPPGIPGMPGQFPGQFPGLPPGMPGNIAAGTNPSSTGDSGSSGSAFGNQNLANAANAPSGMMPGGGPAQNGAAAGLIGQMLTTPRPGGLGGLGQAPGAAMASGMVGVASKMDSEGLMTYNDRTNYKEWEFVYDPSKDRPRQDPRSMLVGNQMGTPSSSTPGTATPGAAAPSGQSGAFNQSGQTGPGGQTGTSPTAGSQTQSQNQGQGGTSDRRPGRK